MSKETIKFDDGVPDDFWSSLSTEEKEALSKAQEEASAEFDNYDEWKEMDEGYFEHLRQRFNKGADEIGPRITKSYQNKFLPLQVMVVPAGRQHDGDRQVQMFHLIVEDMEKGECNGEYSLISETELQSKYNINFNNQ